MTTEPQDPTPIPPPGTPTDDEPRTAVREPEPAPDEPTTTPTATPRVRGREPVMPVRGFAPARAGGRVAHGLGRRGAGRRVPPGRRRQPRARPRHRRAHGSSGVERRLILGPRWLLGSSRAARSSSAATSPPCSPVRVAGAKEVAAAPRVGAGDAGERCSTLAIVLFEGVLARRAVLGGLAGPGSRSWIDTGLDRGGSIVSLAVPGPRRPGRARGAHRRRGSEAWPGPAPRAAPPGPPGGQGQPRPSDVARVDWGGANVDMGVVGCGR